MNACPSADLEPTLRHRIQKPEAFLRIDLESRGFPHVGPVHSRSFRAYIKLGRSLVRRSRVVYQEGVTFQDDREAGEKVYRRVCRSLRLVVLFREFL